ncbi:MAG: DoxX family protein [Xanthomonadales bacterium]|nr:DoxX family protein [Xanthomonadales bacterium]
MALLDLYDRTTARLRAAGDYTWPLVLRLIMFWEFWESGITKLRGSNWFADIPWADWQKGFPWPFNQISTELNWFLATWGELVLSIMILLGLFTRFAAISLVVITVVATAAVHWPAEWSSLGELWSGYLITAKGGGNYKLPLLFIVILLPLVFHGGGRISLDRALLKLTSRSDRSTDLLHDLTAAGLALLVFGLVTVFLEPAWGVPLLVAAAAALLLPAIRGQG